MNPEWKHKKGDVYRPVLSDFYGSIDSWKTAYFWEGGEYLTISSAVKAGMRWQGSDDFNLAVWRNGELRAILWQREVIDDEPEVLKEYERSWSA